MNKQDDLNFALDIVKNLNRMGKFEVSLNQQTSLGQSGQNEFICEIYSPGKKERLANTFAFGPIEALEAALKLVK